MTARYRDTQFSFRVSANLLEQAKERCRQEDIPLSQVLTTALEDFVRHGLRPEPTEKEEDIESFF